LSDKLATAHLELRKALAQAEEAGKSEELKRALASAEKREQAQKDAYAALREQLKTATEKIRELEESADVDAEAYADGNQRLEHRLRELGISFAEAQKELERREAIIRDLTVAVSASEKASTAVARLELEIASERQKVEELVSSLRERTERMAQKDDRIAALEAQLKAQAEENSALLAKAGEAVSQPATPASADTDAPRESSAPGSDDIAERDKRIARLESDLQASAWRTEELEARHADSSRALQSARASLQVSEARIRELEALVDEKEMAVDTIVPDAAPAPQPPLVDDASAQKIELLENELAMAMGTLSGHHRARVEAELALSAIELKHQNIKKELDEAIVQNRALEEELAAALGTVSGQHRARVEAELEIATWQAKAKRSADELDDLIRRSRDMEHALAEASGMIEGHRLARLEAELAISAAEVRNSELNQRIVSLNERIEALESTIRNRDELGSIQHQARIETEQELETLKQKHATLTESYEDILEAFKQAQKELRQQSAEHSEQEGGDDTLAQELAHRDEALAALRDSLNEKAGECSQLEAELAIQKEAVSNLRTQMAETEQRVSWLKTELSNAEAENQHLQTSLRESNDSHQKLQQDFDTLQTRRDELQNANAQLSREKDELNHHLQDVTGDANRLRNDLNGADAELDRVRHQLNESHQEVERLRSELGIGHGEINKLRNDLAGADSEIHRLREEHTRKDGRLAEIETQLQKAEKELHQLRDTMSGSSGEMSRLQEELRGAEDRIRSLSEELGTSRVETERVRNEMSGTGEELSSLRQQLSAAAEESAQLKNNLNGADAELARLRQSIGEIERERDSAQQAADDRIHQLTIAVDDLRDRLKLESERSRNAGADAARWAGKTDELKQVLDARMTELDSVREARDTAVQTLAVLRGELAEAEQKLREKGNADQIQLIELQQRGSQRDEELAELSRKLDEITTARESAVSALSVLRSELEAQEEQKDREATRALDAQNELQSRLDSLTAQLTEKDSAIADLNRKIESMEESVGASDDAFEKQMLQMQQELEAARLEQQALEQKTELLQERLGQKEVQLSDTILRLETATSEADATKELRDMLRQKDEELKVAKDEFAEVQMEFAAKNLEISQARGNEKSANEKLERLRRELEAARAAAPTGVSEDVLLELAELKRKSQSQDETIAELNERLGESQPLIDSLTDQLEQRERNVTRLEKMVRMINGQLKETEGDAVAWDMELKFRDAKISALEEEIVELRNRLK
ncbi:MAG: hypothetical protein JXX14_11540, partial [Deltaproteobacteria bacterium]|nr:hypothetical protein [Deltaproteobacteria bacterium]